MLTDAQINQLLTILSDRNIALDLFEKPVQDFNSYSIKSKYRPFRFNIIQHGGITGKVYSLEITPEDEFARSPWLNEEGIFNNFRRWVNTIQESLNTPDLWAEAAAQLATDAAEKFTPVEAKLLQLRLRELQAELSVLPVSAEQRQAVAEVLAEEIKALNNLPTKQNWLQQVGQKITDKLVDKAADAVLDPTLKLIFAWLLGGLGHEFPELVAFVKHLLPH